jgi:Tfp pilus assembly protein PilF
MSDALSDAERLLATIVAARSRVSALTGDHHAPADAPTKDPLYAEPAAVESRLESDGIEPTFLEDDDTAEVDIPVIAPPTESMVLGLPNQKQSTDFTDDWLNESHSQTSSTSETMRETQDATEPDRSPPAPSAVELPIEHPPEQELLDSASPTPEDIDPPLHVSLDSPEDDPFSFLDLIPPNDPTETTKSTTPEPSRNAPPVREKPIMPLVAAMAAAAPPTLSAPRAVAPQILDPERRTLEVDVVEVEVEEDEDDQVLEMVPKLTDTIVTEPSRPRQKPQPRMEAVFDAMTAGIQALSSGNLQQAHALFSDAIDWNNERIDARIQRGRCARDLGDLVGAMSDFLTVESIAPHAPEPHIEMGDLFFARKDYERAIAHYSDALSRDSEHAMAHCRRGMCHHYQRRADLALQDLQQAQTIDPDIPNIARYVQMVALPRR